MGAFTFATDIITSMSYHGIALLMILESLILPLPSEAILPFAGYLASQHQLSFWYIVIFATLGSLIGSCIAYSIGRFGGRPFLDKYGKYFLLKEKTLNHADEWFVKYGDRAVFFGRLLPIVRYFISLPAGISKMKLWHFVLYTTAGAFLWNLAMTYIGFALGENWPLLSKYLAPFEIFFVIIILCFIVWYIVEAVIKRNVILRRMQEKVNIKRHLKKLRNR